MEQVIMQTGSGRIEIQAPIDYVRAIATMGQNDLQVQELWELPVIQEQLKSIPIETLEYEYKEYSTDLNKAPREDMEKFLLWSLAWEMSDREEI